MTSVTGWTPPSFHPDGSLTAVELPRQQSSPNLVTSRNRPTNDINRDNSLREDWKRGRAKPSGVSGGTSSMGGGRVGGQIKPKSSSDAAKFQWGNDAPSCAVVFGGLNSMYVNPEVWILPLRWREKTVQFFPPPLNSQEVKGEKTESNGGTSGPARLGFASAVRVATSAAAAAAAAKTKVAGAGVRGPGKGGASAVVHGTAVDEAWRLWQARGAAEGGGSGGVYAVEDVGGVGTSGSLGGDRHHRRASLPVAGTAGSALLVDVIRRQHGAAAGEGGRRSVARSGAAGRMEEWEPKDAVEAGEGGVEMIESAAEIEVGLLVVCTVIQISFASTMQGQAMVEHKAVPVCLPHESNIFS